MRLVTIRRGEPVGIIGGGPIGLSVLALVRASGAKVVAISDPRPVRRQVAMRLGASRAVEPAAFVDTVRAATRGRGVDVVFEYSGAADAVDVAIAASDRGAGVALVGINEVDVLGQDSGTRRAARVSQRRQRGTHTPATRRTTCIACSGVDDVPCSMPTKLSKPSSRSTLKMLS